MKINKGTVLFSATDILVEHKNELIELAKKYIKMNGLTSDDVRLYSNETSVNVEAKTDIDLIAPEILETEKGKE